MDTNIFLPNSWYISGVSRCLYSDEIYQLFSTKMWMAWYVYNNAQYSVKKLKKIENTLLMRQREQRRSFKFSIQNIMSGVLFLRDYTYFRQGFNGTHFFINFNCRIPMFCLTFNCSSRLELEHRAISWFVQRDKTVRFSWGCVYSTARSRWCQLFYKESGLFCYFHY